MRPYISTVYPDFSIELIEEFNAIQDCFQTVQDIEIANTEPAKPTLGMLRVADGVGWDPAATGLGFAYLTFYTGLRWEALSTPEAQWELP